MHFNKVPRGLWIKLGINLYECTERQYLLIVDYFSKFPNIYKLNSLSSDTVFNELKEIFSENSIAKVIISDEMPQVRSEFRENTQEWGSPTSISNPHHTTINPMEKKDLSELLDTLTKAYQSGQDQDIALLC